MNRTLLSFCWATFSASAAIAFVGCKADNDAEKEDAEDADSSDSGGAGAEAAPPDLFQGIWMMRVPYREVGDDACAEQLDHNFPGAYQASLDDPWTETESNDRSDAITFVQIERAGEGGALMLMGRQIWVGTQTGDTSWAFTFLATDDELRIEEHETGYQLREERTRRNESVLTAEFSDWAATGSIASTSLDERSWSESDEWVTAVGRAVGSIPVGDYLVYDEGSVEGIPEANLRDERDCSDTRCELTTRTSCAGEDSVSLERTTYDEEDVYDLLEEVYQPFGNGAG